MSKALVLSGGGPVGIAWQTGLAAGLARKGVVLADAQLTRLDRLWRVPLLMRRRRPRRRRARRRCPGTHHLRIPGAAAPADRMAKLMALMADASKEGGSPVDTRKAIGRFALDADTIEEDRFVDVFRYLAGESWPERFRCTAVDAETGEFRVWDKEAGVELERAVASSCAVPGIFPPITLLGRRYMDGGMRSGASVDLAAGHDRVILVTLMGPERQAALAAADDPRMAAMRARAESEVETVREAGGVVEVLSPDNDSAAVMGINLMNASLGPAAAAAGVAQGENSAEAISDFWAS